MVATQTAAAVTGDRKKMPFLVMSAAPVSGHTEPTLYVASQLVKRGFEGVFLSTPEFKDKIEKQVGMEFRETTFYDIERLIQMATVPLGLDRVAFDMEKMFGDSMPGRFEVLRKVLEEVKEREPEREVIIISETCMLGHLPYALGAPVPKGYTTRPKIINLHIMPLWATSVDCAPYGLGLAPDASELGRVRNKALEALLVEHRFASMIKRHMEILTQLGCTTVPTGIPMHSWVSSYDTCFQLCSPGLEYPKSDLHPSIRFAGTLPKRNLDADFPFPAWWAGILENSRLPDSQRKRVVLVSQGTVAVTYEQLLIPTMTGLASRPDTIVIAILGSKGATLPADLVIPANSRVADYFPYDAVLEHTDVFVSNGGYGSMVHAINNGVPMVTAGISEDKMEVSARAEWAGFAVNLRTQTPSKEQVAEGVDRVLGDVTYKRRAERLRIENEDYAPIDLIEREIWKYAG